MLKEVIAVIRSGKWPETKKQLEQRGFQSYTRYRVLGRGRQGGVKYAGDARGGIAFLPRWWVMVVVPDERVEELVEAFLCANRTGEVGDGKIFICPVSESIRIRTDESAEQDFSQKEVEHGGARY